MTILEIFQLLSCLALGLLVGSLLTEAMILVPYWRTMDPNEFLNLHSTLEPMLVRYFAPLTITATVLPVVSALLPFFIGAASNWFSIVSAVLVVAMLVIYFIYFHKANNSFKSGSVGVAGLPAELEKWAKWHWIRVVLGIGAFFISLLVI